MQTVEFFFDFSSPYSYLAATRIASVCERAGAMLEPRPMLLGPVFEAAGNEAPANVPTKGRYMLRDLKMWAAEYGVPFEFPDFFPFSSVRPARLVLALGSAEARLKLTRAFYDAIWTAGRDVTNEEEAVRVATEAGFDGAALAAGATTQPVKDLLRANVDEAIERGVFGAPTFFVGDQMFVGNDRLAFVERAARGERLQPAD